MKLDQYNVLIIEQNGPPGDLGDSCAETGRYKVLSTFVGYFPYGTYLNLEAFLGRDDGFIRHPDVPESWKEKDFTSDQAINLIYAYDLRGPENVSYAVSWNLRWFTAKYNKISLPSVMAASRGMIRTLNWINAVQGLLFKLPVRWSDAKGWFDKSHDSSADYLNWIVTAAYLAQKGLKPILNVRKDVLNEKILSYHANQQNTGGILDVYALAVEKLYRK